MSGARAVVTALAVLAAAPASAFVRSEARETVRDEEGREFERIAPGRCLWWPTSSISYVLNANAANTAGCASPAAAAELARRSFRTWSEASLTPGDVCTSLAFVGGATTGSTVTGYEKQGPNQNLVVWRRGLCDNVAPSQDPCRKVPGACADTYNCWPHADSQTIALTVTSYRVSTGEILDADMELHDRDEARETGHWFTCPDQTDPPTNGRVCPPDARGTPGLGKPDGSCVGVDLGGTVTHEAGHMLGLAHPCEFGSQRDPGVRACAANDPLLLVTMFPTAPPGDTAKRTLTADDSQGVCTIYPLEGPPQPAGGKGQSGTTCATSPARSTQNGGCGCSTARPADAALLLAFGALLRRRRRSKR